MSRRSRRCDHDPALDPRVAAALARMEARIDTPETAAETARAVGLSPKRLETLFREALGTTPAAHALGLRLQAARRMLTDTRHPLAEVACAPAFPAPPPSPAPSAAASATRRGACGAG